MLLTISACFGLRVYYTLGEEVAVLQNNELTTGTYKVERNASDFPSSVYFYQLKIYPANGGAEGFVETKNLPDGRQECYYLNNFFINIYSEVCYEKNNYLANNIFFYEFDWLLLPGANES